MEGCGDELAALEALDNGEWWVWWFFDSLVVLCFLCFVCFVPFLFSFSVFLPFTSSFPYLTPSFHPSFSLDLNHSSHQLTTPPRKNFHLGKNSRRRRQHRHF
jgi:hypothetical protein